MTALIPNGSFNVDGFVGQTNQFSWICANASGAQITPTSITCALFDPNGVQRSPTNTANLSSSTFAPTLDASGSITGVANAYYTNISFDGAAIVSDGWVLQINYTPSGGNSTTVNLGFKVSQSPGAIVPIGGPTVPSDICIAQYGYCSPEDVAITRRDAPYTLTVAGPAIGRTPTRAQVQSLIMDWSDYIDRETGHAWRERRMNQIIKNLDIGAYQYGNRWDSNMRLFDNFWRANIGHRAIRPLVPGVHKIELWDGGSWVDYASQMTLPYGDRQSATAWIDPEKGLVSIYRGLILFRDYRLRLTLSYGESIIPAEIKMACRYLVAADMEISQPGRATTGDADKIQSSDRRAAWIELANAALNRFKEVQIL